MVQDSVQDELSSWTASKYFK